MLFFEDEDENVEDDLQIRRLTCGEVG